MAMPVAAARLLVIEDDPEIRTLLDRFLSGQGYAVTLAGDGTGLETALAANSPDLVLLDVMLPGTSGIDLCRRIRDQSRAGVILLTALSELADKVVGLESGADDYVTKPFELRELAARIRAVLRRRSGDPADQNEGLRFNGWRFEPERRVMYSPANVRVALTGAEADLLLTFCRNPRRVLTRAELIELTRGAPDSLNERAVDLLVSRLRRKLAGAGRQLELIRTVRLDGYVFQPEPGPVG